MNVRQPLACVVLLLSLSISRLFAQAESGTVVGTVTDQVGAAIPSASVVVTHDATKFSRTVIANTSGQYVANLFPSGTLTITVEQPGFERLVRTGIQLTAADTLNDRVLPFFEEHGVRMLRILTDRGSEYCGNRETHEYALYLDIENIEHTRTKAKSPQTNGICERFHQTIQNEFYASAFRRKLYHSLEQLQEDVDAWMA